MRRFGYKSGFIVGLLLFGIGAFSLLALSAAIIGRYPYFLAALFVIASEVLLFSRPRQIHSWHRWETPNPPRDASTSPRPSIRSARLPER